MENGLLLAKVVMAHDHECVCNGLEVEKLDHAINGFILVANIVSLPSP